MKIVVTPNFKVKLLGSRFRALRGNTCEAIPTWLRCSHPPSLSLLSLYVFLNHNPYKLSNHVLECGGYAGVLVLPCHFKRTSWKGYRLGAGHALALVPCRTLTPCPAGSLLSGIRSGQEWSSLNQL